MKELHLRLDRAIVIEKFQFIVSKVGDILFFIYKIETTKTIKYKDIPIWGIFLNEIKNDYKQKCVHVLTNNMAELFLHCVIIGPIY